MAKKKTVRSVNADRRREAVSNLTEYFKDKKGFSANLLKDHKFGTVTERIRTLCDPLDAILGGGIPLFNNLDNPIAFKEVKSEVINNFLVKSHYK